MKKSKVIFILSILTFLFMSQNVYAAECPTGDGPIKGVAHGSGQGATISFGDQSASAYCIDPGAGTIKDKEVICNEGNEGFAVLDKYLEGQPYDIKLLANRIYTQITYWTNSENTNKNGAVQSFVILMQQGKVEEAKNLANQQKVLGGWDKASQSWELAKKALYDAGYSFVSNRLTEYDASLNLLNIATYDDGQITLAPLAAGKHKTYICSTGNGNNQQAWIFSCDEEEDECVDGYYPDGTPCEEEPEGECGSITPTVHGGGNNCCSDTPTTDKMWQDELNDLFCENASLGVKFYYAKGGADYYLDSYANSQISEASDYCQVYCTQKADIWQPGTITATNGRYFKLKDINVKGTESAYIKSYKRCRILIQYDKWETEYYKVVKDQVDNYNWYQESYAADKVYGTIYDVMGVEARAEGSCKEKRTNKFGKIEDVVKTVSLSETVDVPITHFKKQQYDYNTALINPELRIEGSKYDAISVEPNKWGKYNTLYNTCVIQNSHTGGGVYRYIHDEQVIKPEDADAVKAKADALVAQLPGQCSGELLDAHPVYNIPCQENVVETIDKIRETLAKTPGSYASAVENAYDLEKKIYKCEAYLRKPLGEANVLPDAYDVDTDMDFSYVQTYVDDSMRCVTDQQYVKFEPSGGNSRSGSCHITGVFPAKKADAEIGVEEPQFSEKKYKKGYEVMTDCHEKELSFGAIGKFLATERVPEDDPPGDKVIYPAWKSFSNDAWYEAECYKNQGEFDTKTTIPDGYTIVPDKNSTAKFLRNLTVHKKQYYIYVTTLTGKYETFWEMSGVGENGVFDNKIMSENTCSGHQANGTNLPQDMSCNAVDNGVSLEGPVYTCQLKVVSQVIETGKCNEPETPNCEYLPPKNIKQEGFNYFNFKIVDPKNLFPNCSEYGTDNCKYAWNWLEDAKGKAAKAEIEQAAKADLTYSPSNLTYSIKLNTKDIEAIREYNKVAGSYDDFNLDCEECPQDYTCDTTISSPANENTCIETTSCKRCKSTFMTGLYHGALSINNRTIIITEQKGDLLTIRGNNRW